MKVKEPETFTMIRNQDCSGMSGTGRVLDGIIFPCGKVVVCWRRQVNSVQIYDSFEEFMTVHVESHPDNKTEILWSGIEGNPKVC